MFSVLELWQYFTWITYSIIYPQPSFKPNHCFTQLECNVQKRLFIMKALHGAILTDGKLKHNCGLYCNTCSDQWTLCLHGPCVCGCISVYVNITLRLNWVWQVYGASVKPAQHHLELFYLYLFQYYMTANTPMECNTRAGTNNYTVSKYIWELGRDRERMVKIEGAGAEKSWLRLKN